jgi:hypothetical protein
MPNTRKVAGSETNEKGGGSSRAVTRLDTIIGLTGYRTRDLLRIRRVLYRRTRNKWMSFSGFSPSNHDTALPVTTVLFML